MANAGAVPIQGCAIRISQLNPDGSILVGATGMVVDDKPFVSFSAKPEVEAGVEIIPKSACGDLIIAYKDYDRIKRWTVDLSLADWDIEKNVLLGGGSLLATASHAGRAFADGSTANNSTTLTSPALAVFLKNDVGRTVSGTGITAGTWISSFVSSTQVTMSQPATATASGVNITLGTIANSAMGYQYPALLVPSNPNGVAIEIWQKAMIRGTGTQGTTPYPSAGLSPTGAVPLPPSAWIRFGAFRCILIHAEHAIGDTESMNSYTGWAIENSNFGTGPALDWTQTGLAGGLPLDTSRCLETMFDFALPSPLGPGYQTTL